MLEDYEALFRQVFGLSSKGLCKREVYTRLCRASSFDGGTKIVWLDKETGRVCLQVSAKGLSITGVDDRRYWNHIPTEESRFHTVAYLQQTWWFQAQGEIEFPFPPGEYGIFFRLQLCQASRPFGRRVCNTKHVHGWDKKPVQFQLWASGGGQSSASKCCFLEAPGKWVNYLPCGWLQCHPGPRDQHKGQVLCDTDRLHTHQGRPLSRLRIDSPL
ncbi:hypothetical protein SAY86_003908 [Trapa natans]|uniref:Uncharacterized protein n=1 Tax=Trapa natans TaxID=22666 RepID=A0AAN7RN97_TRANT|nr:hypothetical protein SAY86_003908 [Trapa natans]